MFPRGYPLEYPLPWCRGTALDPDDAYGSIWLFGDRMWSLQGRPILSSTSTEPPFARAGYLSPVTKPARLTNGCCRLHWAVARWVLSSTHALSSFLSKWMRRGQAESGSMHRGQRRVWAEDQDDRVPVAPRRLIKAEVFAPGCGQLDGYTY